MKLVIIRTTAVLKKVTEDQSIKASAECHLECQNDIIIMIMPLLLCLDKHSLK